MKIDDLYIQTLPIGNRCTKCKHMIFGTNFNAEHPCWKCLDSNTYCGFELRKELLLDED